MVNRSDVPEFYPNDKNLTRRKVRFAKWSLVLAVIFLFLLIPWGMVYYWVFFLPLALFADFLGMTGFVFGLMGIESPKKTLAIVAVGLILFGTITFSVLSFFIVALYTA